LLTGGRLIVVRALAAGMIETTVLCSLVSTRAA
jgi:hypothetical protein